MRLVSLDLSTKTGWSLFVDRSLTDFGLIERTLVGTLESYGDYPWSLKSLSKNIALQVVEKTLELNPDVIVIEETNKPGRFGSRHSQKCLEQIHTYVLDGLSGKTVLYINTSDWRKKLNLSVAETKKLAKPYIKKLKELQQLFDKTKDKKTKLALKEEIRVFKEELKNKCIHGKIDKKSISVAYCNAKFGLKLIKGNNDIADSICLGQAYLLGVKTLTNSDIFQKGKRDE